MADRSAVPASSLRPLGRALLVTASLSVSPAGAQSLLPGGAWSGPYWGVNGAGAWADAADTRHASQLAWGGHLGYGLQLGMIYAGIEADATWGGAKSTSAITPLYSSTVEIDWSASARARAGITAAGLLLYATAGTAWSGQSIAVHSLGREMSSGSSSVRGFVYGAGIEAKVLPFVSARIEALKYDWGSQSERFAGFIPTGVPSSAWRGLDTDEIVVRAGVSIRLN